MKRINTRYISNFTTAILALSIFVVTSTNSAFIQSAMATGPMTLTSAAAPPANLVSSQKISTTTVEQKRKQVKAVTTIPAEASVAQGVNTAGTVRMNNFTWLEPAVTFALDTGEVCGLLFGAYLIFTAFGSSIPTKGKRVRRAVLGITMMLLGLALPGSANFFVGGSRCGDVVLFN